MIYWYAKDPWETKYWLFIRTHKGVGLKHCNDYKALIEYFQNMNDIYENINECK